MTLRPRALRPLPVSERVLVGLRWLLVAFSLLMVLIFLVAAWRRLHYAFEYDWIEDGMLASVRHIRGGLPLYQAPSVTFTPYLYTPVYLYAAAALSKIVGLGYPALRLLSLFATLGCFGALYALVFSEIRRHIAAIAAVGLFAACYPAVNASFDIGRVDMLYLFFVLCAFYASRRLNPILAALLWVCAFQTKQGVLPIAVLALCHDWQRPRRVALGLASFSAAMAITILWLNHVSGGWYRYYVFGMVGGYGYVWNRALRFLPDDLFAVTGIALLTILASLLAAAPSLRSRATSFYAFGSVGMILFTGYLRAHRGANVNSLLPAYVWIAALFGVAIGRLLLVIEARAADPAGRPASDAALALLLLAATIQLAARFYTPNEFVPIASERSDRAAFEEEIRSIPGDVLVSGHPEDDLMAGKPVFANSEATGSVIDATDLAKGDDLMRQYSALLHSGKVSAVAVDISAEEHLVHSRTWMPRDFLAIYPLRVAAAGGTGSHFGPEPRWIYLPCASIAVARRLDPLVDVSSCNPLSPH